MQLAMNRWLPPPVPQRAAKEHNPIQVISRFERTGAVASVGGRCAAHQFAQAQDLRLGRSSELGGRLCLGGAASWCGEIVVGRVTMVIRYATAESREVFKSFYTRS